MPLPRVATAITMSFGLTCATAASSHESLNPTIISPYAGEGYDVVPKNPDVVYDWNGSSSVLVSPRGVDCTTQVLLDEHDRIIGLGLTSLDENMVDSELMDEGMFGQEVTYTHDHFELNINIENEVDSSGALPDRLRILAAMACQRFYDKVIHKK